MNRPLSRDPNQLCGPPAPSVLEALVVGRSRPRPYRSNVQTILARDPRLLGQLRLDTLAQRIEWVDQPGEDARPGVEVFFERVYDFRPTKALLVEEMLRVAVPVHPVAEWLDQLEWDRQPRLDRVLHDLLGAEPAPLLSVYGRRLFIGLVARARAPGCKLDTVTLLSGPQGIYKSSFVAALCPNPAWYASVQLDTRTKDGMQDLVGKWLIELAEVEDFKAANSGPRKAFLTRSTDRYRPSYGSRSEDFPRTCAFLGTTNETELLSDPTGARRYWPVALHRPIDLDAVAAVRDQLFAEADHRYHAGEPWWLQPDEARTHEEAARDWRRIDSWEPLVLQWVERNGTGFTTDDVLAKAVHKPHQRPPPAGPHRLAHLCLHGGPVDLRVGVGVPERRLGARGRGESQRGGGVGDRQGRAAVLPLGDSAAWACDRARLPRPKAIRTRGRSTLQPERGRRSSAAWPSTRRPCRCRRRSAAPPR